MRYGGGRHPGGSSEAAIMHLSGTSRPGAGWEDPGTPDKCVCLLYFRHELVFISNCEAHTDTHPYLQLIDVKIPQPN